MILVIDNSLKVDNIKGIVGALDKLGVSKHKVIKNYAQLAKVRQATVKGIILSGSEMMVNDTDMQKYADKFMLNMIALVRFDVPVLAICFGCQLVNYMFGGSMRKLEHKLDKVMLVKLSADKGAKRNAKFNCRYVIDKVSPDMEAAGVVVHNGKEITCLLKHKTRPITGTLFHPEACDDTIQIIGVFVGK